MPTSESTLLLLVAHLTILNLSHATIKVISPLYDIYMHVTISITQQLTPQLQQGLKGQELARLSKQLAAGGPSPRDSQFNLCKTASLISV